jgi:hypothetical protein
MEGQTQPQVKRQLGGNQEPLCDQCPCRTPFEPTERLRRRKELYFEEPLDEGIREIVLTLIANGVETFESCEGGPGHVYPWPTVPFTGMCRASSVESKLSPVSRAPDCSQWRRTTKYQAASPIPNAPPISRCPPTGDRELRRRVIGSR